MEEQDERAARIAALEAELAAAREEARQNYDRWVRERADLENLKKRAAREREEAVRLGNESLIRDLLPVMDNLERALRHAEAGGVRRIEAGGAVFDPAHHEAVAHVESTEHPPNVVVEEHQPGYRLHDRLLRPALVTVAKAPAGSDRETEGSEP